MSEALPCSIKMGDTKTDKYYLTHAIWRNSYGSRQAETGVRSVKDGVVQKDFQLIEHGCHDFQFAEQVILKALAKGWNSYRIGTTLEWLAERKRPKAVFL